MTKPEFYLVQGEVGARLGLVFGEGRDPAVDILTQIQQRYLKPSFLTHSYNPHFLTLGLTTNVYFKCFSLYPSLRFE